MHLPLSVNVVLVLQIHFWSCAAFTSKLILETRQSFYTESENTNYNISILKNVTRHLVVAAIIGTYITIEISLWWLQ